MDSESKNETPLAPSVRARSILVALLVAIPVMLTFITIPLPPVDLDTDADTSLSAVMDYALEHGLHLGTDLVHTYGPLGHLIFFYFAPHIAGIRLLTDLALGYTVAAGLCLVAWRLRWPARCSLLGIFIFINANMHPRTDLVIDAGSLCWGLLCCVESGRRLTTSAVVFTALAVFAALAKNSFLFVSGSSLVILCLLLATKSHWRLGAGMIAGFALGVVGGWVAWGPGIARLPEAAVNAFSIVQAYNQALGWDTLLLSFEAGLATLTLAIPMLVLRSMLAFDRQERFFGLRRVLLLAWISALLFFDWKHGFVRGDMWHVAYFFGFVPLLALGLEIFPARSTIGLRWARVLAGGCCGVCLLALQLTYFPSLPKSLATPFQAFYQHSRDVLMPGDYRRRMNDFIEADRRKADLPQLRKIIGDASVDVFGQSQVYALLNGMNYYPRPVFQSYAACSARMTKLNEQFHLSTNAPEYLMFSLGPIDRRFPALEDSRLLRDCLFNFKLAGAEGPFFLLKRHEPAPTPMTLAREGEVVPGGFIDLKDYGVTNLWLEIDLKPSLAGRLRQFLYRPPTVRLAAWREHGSKLLLKRRAPPVMLAAGFLASPLMARDQDLVDFLHGAPVTRPAGYSVEILPGEEWFWQSRFHYRIYQIERATPAPAGGNSF